MAGSILKYSATKRDAWESKQIYFINLRSDAMKKRERKRERERERERERGGKEEDVV